MDGERKICPFRSLGRQDVDCLEGRCALYDEYGGGCGFAAKLPEIVQQKLREGEYDDQPSGSTYNDLTTPDYDLEFWGDHDADATH